MKNKINGLVDAVSSAGGGVLMLASASLLLLGALLFASHYRFAPDDVITIRTTFVGFSGALLLALKSEGKAGDKSEFKGQIQIDSGNDSETEKKK
jgi:hypothetical protein